MVIPNNQAFESFLLDCSVVTKEPTGPSVVVTDESRLMMDGRPGQTLYLQYSQEGVQLETMVNKISDALQDNGIPASYEAALTTLSLIVETRGSDASPVEHANQCLSRTQRARLIQSVVVPGRPRPDYQVNLGTYTIRAFDAQRVLYWADRCNSAYPIDLRTLNGWAALERDPVDLLLIDWTAAIQTGPLLARWGRDTAASVFLDCYYAAIAKAYANEIQEKLKADVLVLESAAMLWIGIEDLLDSLFLKIISHFSWKSAGGMAGWATYSDQSHIHANFPNQEGLSSCRDWLANELGFSTLSDSSLFDASVKTYCRFLQRAHGHRIAGRTDESFLHFAIALDLLFGAEGRSSDSIGNRAAFVAYRHANTSFDDECHRVKRLYGVRSKYVHEGKSVTAVDLHGVETVCMGVLWALLYVSAKTKIREIGEWIRELDVLIAGNKAKRNFAEAEFLALGLPPERHTRQPPLRVLESGRTASFSRRPPP